MKARTSRKPNKPVKEFFLALAQTSICGAGGRVKWRNELLRARSPEALLRMLGGREHLAYACNGIEVLRIDLIDARTFVLAPVHEGAQAEPLESWLKHHRIPALVS